MSGFIAKVLTAVTRAVAGLAAVCASAIGATAPAADGVVPAQGLVGHGGPVRAIIALDDGRTLVTAGFDSAIIVWDLERGSARRVLRFHDGIINALTSLGGDCFASAGEDRRIAVWCGLEAAPKAVLEGHTGPIAALAVAPDRKTLASASWDHSIRVWRLDEGGAAPRVIEGHGGPVNAVAFTPDGAAVLSGGYDAQLRLTYLAPGRAPLIRQVEAPVNAVRMLDQGLILAASADGRLRALDMALEPRGALHLPDGPLTTIAVSPDLKTIATAGMRTPVTLVERDGLRQRRQILGPGLPIWSLAFSTDNRQLFTGGADRAVRRWDPAEAKPAGGDIAEAEKPVPAGERSRGEQVFRACRACHGLTAADVNLAGPTFHGLFGRRIATAPGYVYSEALRKLDIVWTPETVSKLFEVGPAAYTPGTKMPEQRLTDPDDRTALVEWLAKVTEPSGGTQQR